MTPDPKPAPQDAMHEVVARGADDDGAPPTERSFAIVFSGVFVLLAGLRFWRGHADAPAWLVIAALFALLGVARPALLRPLNRAWWRLGLLLHRLVSPVVMGLLFFGAVMPVGLLMRLFGKDPLKRQRDPAAATYWVPCDSTERGPDRMRDQF